MKIKTQYSDEKLMGGNQLIIYPSDLFDPVEGFVPGQCEPLGTLIKRISSGQFVATLPEGIGEEDQIFDDVMTDDFAALDEHEVLIEQQYQEKRRKVAQKKSAAAPPAPEPPTPEDNQ